MQKSGLGNFPSFKRDSAPHQRKQNNGKSNDSQTANLKKYYGNNLPDKGQIFTYIYRCEACYANCGRGRKESIDKTQIVLRCGERKPQGQSAQHNKCGETENKDSSRCQMTGKERRDDQIKLHIIIFTLRDNLRCFSLFAISDHVPDH